MPTIVIMMRDPWADAFYDASNVGGTDIFIQAEVGWAADLEWVHAARDFAQTRPRLRRELEAAAGELKSSLYFSILQDEEAKRRTWLIDAMLAGPQEARIYIYERAEFWRRGHEELDVTLVEAARHHEVEVALAKHSVERLVASSPIANLQDRLAKLGLAGYRPLLKREYFDPGAIAHMHRHKYRSLVQVAARTHAVFGDLDGDLDDPERIMLARRSLDQLVRVDRLFDREHEKSLIQVLCGVFEIELAMNPLDLPLTRRAVIEERKSQDVDGIQVSDVAAAVARRIIEKHDGRAKRVSDEALSELRRTFSRVVLNGVASF